MPSASGKVPLDLLGESVRAKRTRDQLTLREAADNIGISAPTLQRVEGGQMPTISTVLRLADWLGITLDDLRSYDMKDSTDNVQRIEMLLRADPNLSAEAAVAVANLVRAAYMCLGKAQEDG